MLSYFKNSIFSKYAFFSFLLPLDAIIMEKVFYERKDFHFHLIFDGIIIFFLLSFLAKTANLKTTLLSVFIIFLNFMCLIFFLSYKLFLNNFFVVFVFLTFTLILALIEIILRKDETLL